MIGIEGEYRSRAPGGLEQRQAHSFFGRRPPRSFTSNDFERGDRVITPLGETARVLGRGSEGRLELRYDEAFSEYWAYVALKPELLRRVYADRRMPEPVRLKDWQSGGEPLRGTRVGLIESISKVRH